MADNEQDQISNALQRGLLRLQELPPPSALALQILDVVTNDHADLEQVAAVIENHPQLTARILRCANSAYYGQRGKIFSVAEAIIRVLGLSVTKALALALTLQSTFATHRCPAFKEERYWLSAALAAALARGLAPLLRIEPRPDPGAAYTAGLLHNIGVLALVDLFPEEMSRAFAGGEPEAETRKARALLGTDTQQAGAFLARRWGLPEPLVEAIGRCRDRDSALDQPLAAVVHIAVVGAEAMLRGEAPETLPAAAWAGFLDPADMLSTVTQVGQRVDDLRVMAQLLSGGRR